MDFFANINDLIYTYVYVVVFKYQGYHVMERLPATSTLKKADAFTDFMAADLPADAAEVICQLLSVTGDEVLKAVALRVSRRHTFVLSAGVGESGDALIQSLPVHRFSHTKRELPNPAEYVQLEPNAVGQWFQPGGEFERAVPDYEYREEQYAMAVAVADAFSSQRHLVVEAGTGVGKTMAYLVPAVLWTLANKIPVVISTNTKNLQEQIFYKDVPTISRIVRTPFKSALIKGRSNYLCLNRLANLLRNRESELRENQLLPLAHACAWIFKTRSGDLSEFPYARAIADQLASTSEDCRGRKCPYYTRCFLRAARQASLNADIVITNHSVYFSEPDNPLALPLNAQVIFDEAHNLEEAATRKFIREVSPYSFFRMLRSLHVSGRKQASGVLSRIRQALYENNFMTTADARDALFAKLDATIKLTNTVRVSGRRFLLALVDLLPEGSFSLRLRPAYLQSYAWNDRLPLLQKLQDDLYALQSELDALCSIFTDEPSQQAGDDGTVSGPLAAPVAVRSSNELSVQNGVSDFGHELGLVVSSVVDISDALDFTTSVEDADWVYWVSLVKGRDKKSIGSLHAAPIEIARYMAESLFEKKESVVLCSATMNVGGSPAFISHRIGLDQVDPDRVVSRCVGSPFDYSKQCLAAVPMFLPNVAGSRSRAEDDYTRAFSDFTVSLAVVTRGRMLVLFTSYRMMRTCAERVSGVLERAGIRLLVQGGGQSRERITQLFREDHPSVLMGTDSFWEGVDLIGEALSCLVIARLPFDAIADPVISSRSERVAENGGDSFRDFALPNAVIKFRQGFGRLIRHNDDRGIVVVADQRIFTKNYGSTFRKSLPAELIPYKDAEKLLKDAAAFLETEGDVRYVHCD